MPRVTTQLPPVLRPYASLGLQLGYVPGREEVPADCPFCGGEQKLSVNAGSGLWRCFACNEGSDSSKVTTGGEVKTFLRRLHEHSLRTTAAADYAQLARDRKLLSGAVLRGWGACRSV